MIRETRCFVSAGTLSLAMAAFRRLLTNSRILKARRPPGHLSRCRMSSVVVSTVSSLLRYESNKANTFWHPEFSISMPFILSSRPRSLAPRELDCSHHYLDVCYRLLLFRDGERARIALVGFRTRNGIASGRQLSARHGTSGRT
jgi:hypothetical protein